METLIHTDPKILITAFFGGIFPALLWLWFWIKEEEKKSEPKGLITVIFIMGMIAVICVLPIQRFIQVMISSDNLQLILSVCAEEIIKFLAILVIVYKSNCIEEPIEWPIYLVTAALGFAALENALFLIKPLKLGQDTLSLMTGQLRFLGSTLLHTVSSGILGVALGMSFYIKGFPRKIYIFAGLILAITLHSVFNFFIIRVNMNEPSYLLEVLKIFGFLWVVTIIVMLLYEKVRKMN